MNIAIINTKGGVGKTTLATALAYAWRDHKPRLIDLDEQRATMAFELAGVEVEVATVSQGATIARQSERLTLFDCPPSLVLSAPVLAQCQAALLPVEGAFLPYRAALPLRETFAARYPDLDVRFVLTRYIGGRTGARDVREAAREEWGAQLCETIIPSSPIFDECASQGLTVLQGAGEHRAARSVEKLARELALLWELKS